MDYLKEYKTLCEILSERLAEKIRKVKNNGMNDGDLETLDKLTHTLASTKKIIAFSEDEDGYSGNDGGRSYRGVYRESYARGGQRRDSMGRYSRSDLADKMRELMEDAPDDRTRQEMRRMVEKLENA